MSDDARERLASARFEKLQEMASERAAQASSEVVIRVSNLHKSFGPNHVLRGIDLEVEEGKTTVIIGSSGSGKSVFIKHLIGLMRPDEGSIDVYGEDITKMSLRHLNEVRKKFGMCFQMAALFDSMTIEQNVAFPLVEHTKLKPSVIKEKVHETLLKVGLKNVGHLNPSELSGGMRKRVGLARAVILNPSIVIYDEPTTGLDPLLTEEIDNMILDAQRDFQVTSIVISHDIGSIFRIADRIVMLYEGHLRFNGTSQELLLYDDPIVQRFITTFG